MNVRAVTSRISELLSVLESIHDLSSVTRVEIGDRSGVTFQCISKSHVVVGTVRLPPEYFEEFFAHGFHVFGIDLKPVITLLRHVHHPTCVGHFNVYAGEDRVDFEVHLKSPMCVQSIRMSCMDNGELPPKLTVPDGFITQSPIQSVLTPSMYHTSVDYLSSYGGIIEFHIGSDPHELELSSQPTPWDLTTVRSAHIVHVLHNPHTITEELSFPFSSMCLKQTCVEIGDQCTISICPGNPLGVTYVFGDGLQGKLQFFVAPIQMM